jgi:HlyD family secretion protein
MKKNLLIAIAFVTLVSVSCSDNKKDNLEYSGTIESTELIVSSQLPGMIETLLFDKGDFVNNGDTLAIINHTKLDLQLVQANAKKDGILTQIKMLKRGARKEDRNLAKEALQQAEANLNVVTKNKERMEKLLASESITQKQYDDAILAFDIANSRYISAKQNVKKSKSARPEQIELLNSNLAQIDASIALIKQNINDCYITSPIPGQIVNRFIEKGEVVSFLSSLFKVIDLTKAELTIYVPETELAFIQLKQNVEIYIDAFTDKSFNGIITFISPEAEFTPKNIQTKDERTKLVFAVKIDIDNSDKILKIGMPADAVLKITR